MYMLAAVIVGEDPHHAGMVHVLADLFFAAEAVVRERIALHFGMRNLDGDLAIVASDRWRDRSEAIPLRAISLSMR